MIGAEAIMTLLNKKTEGSSKKILGDNIHIVEDGFVGTESGEVLTSDGALRAALDHEEENT